MGNLTSLKEAARHLVGALQAGSISDRDKLRLVQINGEIERQEAIDAAEKDVALFAYYYFSDEYNADNGAGNFIANVGDSKHEALDEVATIHRKMYELASTINRNGSGKYAILAPRGHAKTTVLTTIFALHQIVYKRRKYVIILSETDVLAKRILASINAQLKFNDKLRRDFGELLSPISTQNETDNEVNFVTANGQLVEASSSGKALRGKTFRGNRPDLILADDLSSMSNEGTEAQRDKLLEWWNTTITPLGATNAAYVLVGTRVTATGLIATLSDLREYKAIKYSAIISGPFNKHLWDDYLELYNSDTSDEELDAFYEKNREAMELGIELAWPKRWTYRALMHEKATIGSRAFASEYLNESFADDEQFFKVDSYKKGRRCLGEYGLDSVYYDERHYYVRDMDIICAYDPAIGESARADLNAMVVLGRHRETGRVFVLDDYAERCSPSEFLATMFERLQAYPRVHKIILEGIGAYRFLSQDVDFFIRRHHMQSTRLDIIKSHKSSKQQRIDSLEVPLSNGGLVLCNNNEQLLQQLKYYPTPGEKVDLLDALQMAFERTFRGAIRSLQRKPLRA